MVRAFSSGGSFQGNTVVSAFGASSREKHLDKIDEALN